jgi:hypothetical protein
MSFHVEVRPLCWTGVSASGPAVISTTMMPEPLLDTLLDSFGSVFAEPTGLPPQHAHDHHITLKAGVLPVAVRPYRYRRPTRMSWNASAPP